MIYPVQTYIDKAKVLGGQARKAGTAALKSNLYYEAVGYWTIAADEWSKGPTHDVTVRDYITKKVKVDVAQAKAWNRLALEHIDKVHNECRSFLNTTPNTNNPLLSGAFQNPNQPHDPRRS